MIINSLITKVDKLNMFCFLIADEHLIQLNNGEEKGRYNQRVIINVNNQLSWQGGVVVFGDGYGYITLSKARMKQLDKVEGETVQLELTKDDSKYGHEFPIELQEIFAQDSDAKKRFDALTPGKHRTTIYYILQNKSSEKRIEKSVEYMRNLKNAPHGKETMRMILKGE